MVKFTSKHLLFFAKTHRGLLGPTIPGSAVPNPNSDIAHGFKTDRVRTRGGEAYFSGSFFSCFSLDCRLIDLEISSCHSGGRKVFFHVFPHSAWTQMQIPCLLRHLDNRTTNIS